MPTTADIHDRYTDTQITSYFESGLWTTESLFDVIERQADVWGEKNFVFDSTTSVSYVELRDRAVALAAGLKREGLNPGDHVAVQLPNWTEFAVVTAALSRLGAVLVPIMPVYRDEEVRYVLGHAEIKAVITCEEFKGYGYGEMFTRLQKECPDVRTVYTVRASESCQLPRLEDVESSTSDAEKASLEPGAAADDHFAIVYTSGTTSRPKGCLHTFNTYRASAAAIAASINYTDKDVQFGPSPISHSTGLVTSLVLPLLAGASSHLVEAWEPNDGLERIAKYGCTVSVTATAFLQMLLAAYDPKVHDASSMRLWVAAGSPIPGAVVRAVNETLPNCRVLSLYGRSENLLTTMCTVADDSERSVVSDGSAVAGSTVRIVDEQGVEVPRGTEGDIAYQGPSHMLEYYRDPVQTDELFTPSGFSRSGDLGRMDADGFVRVTGRLKDIVIRGGMNISAREIEDLVVELPSVANVAVVGMPDERLGEKVCVFVVAAPGEEPPTLDDIASHLTGRKVAKQKFPERIEVRDSLPMTATGKLQKHLLMAELAESLAESVVS